MNISEKQSNQRWSLLPSVDLDLAEKVLKSLLATDRIGNLVRVFKTEETDETLRDGLSRRIRAAEQDSKCWITLSSFTEGNFLYLLAGEQLPAGGVGQVNDGQHEGGGSPLTRYAGEEVARADLVILTEVKVALHTWGIVFSLQEIFSTHGPHCPDKPC